MPLTALHRRLALWAIACVMVLKAAVPLLASMAAGQQGRSVADVCDVYGVRLPAAVVAAHATLDAHSGHVASHEGHHGHGESDAAGHGALAHPGPTHAAEPDDEAPPAHGPAHTTDHCALSALAALAAQPMAMPPLGAANTRPEVALPASTLVRDATADWVAQLKHGPPQAT